MSGGRGQQQKEGCVDAGRGRRRERSQQLAALTRGAQPTGSCAAAAPRDTLRGAASGERRASLQEERH